MEKQNEYLRKQLVDDMKQKQKALESPSTFVHDEDEASNLNSSSSVEEPQRRVRGVTRMPQNSNDFKVEIPEFERKLDPDEFLEWLHNVVRVFNNKDIPDDKKVKLVALRLRRYASLWWTNLCAKITRNRKGKIRT